LQASTSLFDGLRIVGVRLPAPVCTLFGRAERMPPNRTRPAARSRVVAPGRAPQQLLGLSDDARARELGVRTRGHLNYLPWRTNLFVRRQRSTRGCEWKRGDSHRQSLLHALHRRWRHRPVRSKHGTRQYTGMTTQMAATRHEQAKSAAAKSKSIQISYEG